MISEEFEGDIVAGLSHDKVKPWFASLSDTPSQANHALVILRAIVNEAKYWGAEFKHGDPTDNIRFYSIRNHERHLSLKEMARLGAAIVEYIEQAIKENNHDNRIQAAALLLIILTGCLPSEILNRRWSDYRDKHLYIDDGGWGPKIVYLPQLARDVLDGLNTREEYEQIFIYRGTDTPYQGLSGVWNIVREKAGIENFALKDFNYNFISIAKSRGLSGVTVGKLKGYRAASSTLRYMDLDNAKASENAQMVSTSLAEAEPENQKK
jgi:integrase